MKKSALACIILAAGRGTRMRSELPKVLHPVAGLPMLGHVIRAAGELGAEQTVVVVGPEMDNVAKFSAPHPTVVQTKQQGTADAVRMAEPRLGKFDGYVLILYGDTPLVDAEALRALRDAGMENNADVVVAAFTPADSGAYGRVVVNGAGQVTAIVEVLDATPEQKNIKLCNGGMMLLAAPKMWELLARIKNNNAKKEYYLTDIVKLAHEDGLKTAYAEISEDAVLGVNDRVELAVAERIFQRRTRERVMRAGASLPHPESVHFAYDTVVGQDVTIGQNVVFAPGVVVEDKAQIRPFCHLEGVRVGAGSTIGPFARLRPGTKLGNGVHIGNFVELKNATVDAGSKINHLTYIGDAEIGSAANIGAGTITCNYDGFKKHMTIIGNGAFIGSNTSLVAPVEVGNGAFVGAGSVITEDVPADTLAVARGRQVNLENWAQRFRDSKKQK